MKLTIDICDCDKACLIRDWLPCPHLTNERPPLALSDQSAASVTLSVAFSWFPRLLVTTGCSPHPLPVQSPLSGSHVNTGKQEIQTTEWLGIREILGGHGAHQYLVTLVTFIWEAQAVTRLGQLWILKVAWQSDAMPEGPDTLVRSPDLHREIDNRYVVEKQPRRVSWCPELALEEAWTLNLEPVSFPVAMSSMQSLMSSFYDPSY